MNTRTTYDVLVAGGGFAGLCAALFAARSGKRTLIITRGAGVLAIGGGTIDVLGADVHGNFLHSPFDGLSELPPRHPYSLVGEQTVRDALEAFLELCLEGDYEYVRSDAGNTRLVTALGTSKPTFLVPRSLSMRGFEDADTVYVAGIEGLKDFSPRLVADGLAGRPLCAGKKLIPVVLPAPFRLQRDLGTLDLAPSSRQFGRSRMADPRTLPGDGLFGRDAHHPDSAHSRHAAEQHRACRRGNGRRHARCTRSSLLPQPSPACDCTRCSTVCSGNTGWM